LAFLNFCLCPFGSGKRGGGVLGGRPVGFTPGKGFCLVAQGVEEDGVALGWPKETAVIGIAAAKYFCAAVVAERMAPAKRDECGGAIGESR
jgi:hypothetical protein